MATNQSIINTYLELGAANGFDNVSMKDIADRTGVRKATLFSHFRNYEELKDSAVAFCRESLEKIPFTIDFRAPSKERLFEELVGSYSDSFSSFPLNCYVSLLEQKRAFEPEFEEMSHQLNMIICSRLTVALDFCVQHGWSDIKDTERLAWLLTLCLRDGSDESIEQFSSLI